MEDQGLGVPILVPHPFPVKRRQRLTGRPRVPADERQLEHLRQRKAPRRIPGQRPDEVDHAIARLPVEVRRPAAELHRREHLDRDATIRPGRDLLRPRHEEQLVHDGLRRVERMHPQREGLGAGTVGRRAENARGENRPPGELAHHTQGISDIGDVPQPAADDRLPPPESRSRTRYAHFQGVGDTGDQRPTACQPCRTWWFRDSAMTAGGSPTPRRVDRP